jgi:hypothetical protein
MFVRVHYFHPSLIFASKAKSLPEDLEPIRVELFKGLPFSCRLQTLNMKLGWRWLPVTNFLTTLRHLVKSQLGLYYKTFYGRNLRIFMIS